MENEQNSEISCILHENDEMIKYPPIDEKKLKLNPFAESLVIPATNWTDTGKYVYDDDKKEMVSASAVVEKDKYTRVYRRATTRNEMMQLSPAALKLLVWIMQDVDDAKEWVRVMPEWYAKHGGKGASRTQYKKAADELMVAGYICKTCYNYVYWINPAIFCAGNRVAMYPDKVIVKNNW